MTSARTLRVILVTVALVIVAAEVYALAMPAVPPPAGGGTSPVTVSVAIPAGAWNNSSLNFTPDAVTVVIGVNNTVVFTNQDSKKQTVTAPDGSFNSGDLGPGASWTYTFSTPGTYTYYSVYHYWMRGTITVLQG